MITNCRVCNCGLIPDDNWSMSKQKNQNYICNDCMNKRTAIWKEKNYERKVASDRAWKKSKAGKDADKRYQEKHKESIAEYQSGYHKDKWLNDPDYRERIQNTRRIHDSNNRDHINARQRELRKADPVRYNGYQAKRDRDLGWNPLFENPFAKSVKVDWHHIDNTYVVAIPRELHYLYGSNDRDKHREGLMYIVNQIYCIILEQYPYT